MSKQTTIITALVISVGINLLVAGFLVGRLASDGGSRGDRGNGWVAQWLDPSTLDPSTRKTLREAFKAHNKAARPARQRLVESQRSIRELLAQENFDPGAMRDALADLRAQMSQYQALRHEQMVTTLSKLPPEQRLRVYRFLSERGLRKRGERKPR